MSSVHDVVFHDFTDFVEKGLPGPVSAGPSSKDDDLTDPVDDMSAAENVGNETARAAAPSVLSGTKIWNGLAASAKESGQDSDPDEHKRGLASEI
jgi:hypothetical protein